MKTNIKISGISCGACVKLIQKRIGGIEGVQEVNIDKDSGQTEIISQRVLPIEKIKSSLKDTPYDLT